MLNGDERFETAQDWIRACTVDCPDWYADAMASVCKKRKGIWSLVKNRPRDDRRAAAWEGFRQARHAFNWGSLSAWTDGVTMRLMLWDEDTRQLFEDVFDETLRQAKIRLKGKAAS